MIIKRSSQRPKGFSFQYNHKKPIFLSELDATNYAGATPDADIDYDGDTDN
jgi:hypothetical protein